MGQTFNSNMRASAYRHLEAATNLTNTTRKDVAGYLFGVAAECALKQMMIGSGMRPLAKERRRDDPFYAHFAELKAMISEKAYGRLATELRRYAENSSFMQHWDISMRYSDGKEIRAIWIERWEHDAKTVIGTMDS